MRLHSARLRFRVFVGLNKHQMQLLRLETKDQVKFTSTKTKGHEIHEQLPISSPTPTTKIVRPQDAPFLSMTVILLDPKKLPNH